MEAIHTQPAALAGPDIDNYILLEKIGEGGYGLVYKATQVNTGQMVAIKLLKFQEGLDAQRKNYQIIRFERETQLCAEINHPNIVKLLDKGYTAEQAPYAVFEFVSGETLKDAILANNGLSALETQELMGQVLDALACAHAKGIVHRDLKPHNIMVTRTGSRSHVKILDFGIGAFTHEFRGNDYQSLTLTREVMGTPAYSAPEQLRGEPPTVKSDLYAWGLILLECLTGAPVMQGDSVAEVFQQQLRATNVPLPPAIAGHPLANLLRRVLEKNPRLRVGKAADLNADFSRINFSSLVGKIDTGSQGKPATDQMTAANDLGWQDIRSEKRQITVLCVKLSMVISKESTLDLETIDTLQKDQLNLCKDTGIRFGAHMAGEVAGNICMYFGYPQVSDNDARRAGRTALELISEIRKRSALLFAQHGLRLEVRMGLHSGTVLSQPNHTPEGMVPNVAFNLLYNAPAGTILASDATKKLLDPFLEFEGAQAYANASLILPTQAFRVAGERQTEALSFLRPWSANRAMIGRDTERDTVLNHWAVAREGHGQAVILHGLPGIGKSKMVYEVKKQVRADGFLFRECRCLPEHQNNALFPFLDMLRNHWGMGEISDPTQAIAVLEAALQAAGVDVMEAMPILCAWLSIPLTGDFEVSQATPDVQKQILFQALLRSILHIGKEKSFLLVLEDLHWLDPTGQEFVAFLLTNLSDESCLVLMTTRPVFVPEWKADYLYDLHLEPLTENATEALVESVLDGKTVDEKALVYINDRADGVPLYIEELTRMLVEEHYLILQADVYLLNEDSDVQDIPMTLQDLLNARLDRLGQAKESAQVAATIGREFNYELLVRASLRDEANVQADLDALMDADLVIRQRRVQDESYIFRHALIRDAAYEGMLGGARKGHHLRIAETLKRDFPEVVEENPFEVGRHLAGGDDFEGGSAFGMIAIEKQIGKSANLEAISANNIILSWVEQIRDATVRALSEIKANLIVQPAYSYTEGMGSEHLGRIARRNALLIKGIEGNTDLEMADEIEFLELKSEWGIFIYDHAHGNYKEAQGVGEEILRKAIKRGNHDAAMASASILSQSYSFTTDIEKSKERSQYVLDHFDIERDDSISNTFGVDAYTFANGPLALHYALEGNIKKGIELLDNGLAYVRDTNDPSRILHAYLWKMITIAAVGDLEAMRHCFNELNSILDKEQRDKVFQVIMLFPFTDWIDGKVDAALNSIKGLKTVGQTIVLPYLEYLTMETLTELGRFDEAIALGRESVERQEAYGEKLLLARVLTALAIATFGKDKNYSTEVDTLFEKASTLASQLEFTFLEVLNKYYQAECLGLAGKIEEKADLVHTYQHQFQKYGQIMAALSNKEALNL